MNALKLEPFSELTIVHYLIHLKKRYIKFDYCINIEQFVAVDKIYS